VFPGQRCAGLVDSTQHRAFVEIVPDTDAQAAEDMSVDRDLEGHGPTVHLGQPRAQPLFLLVGERMRDKDIRELPVASLGGQLDQPGQRGGEVATADSADRQLGQPDCRRPRLAVQERVC
jgi:hypothetical protein